MDLGIPRSLLAIRPGRPEQMRIPVLRQQNPRPRARWASPTGFTCSRSATASPIRWRELPAALLAVALALRPGRGTSLTGALVEGLAVTMGLWGLTVIARALVNAGRMAPVPRRRAPHPRPHRGARGAPLDAARVGAPVPPSARVVRSAGVSRSTGGDGAGGRLGRRVLARRGAAPGRRRRLALASAVLVLRGASLPRRCAASGARRAGPRRVAGGVARWCSRARGSGPSSGRALAALPGHRRARRRRAAGSAGASAGPGRPALFVAGGLLSLALSAVQHLVRWSIPVPGVLRLPVDRVHETFGGEDSLRRRRLLLPPAAAGARLGGRARPGGGHRAPRPRRSRIPGARRRARRRLRRLHRPHLRPGGAPHRAAPRGASRAWW